MKYELEIITDISKTIAGKSKVIIKNAKVKRLFDLDKIDISVYIDDRTGREVKKYTSISENDMFFKVNKPYEELKNLILNRTSPVLGFMAKSKLHKKRIRCEDIDTSEGLPTPEHLGNTDSYILAYCKSDKRNKK